MLLADNSYDSLNAFFEPKSIAIIGASDDPRKPGGRPQQALVNKGYRGNIYPVNPKYETIQGLKCYPSIDAIPEPVDLAIISVPAALVQDAVEQCAQSGVQAAVIFSSGFAEVGVEGKLAQDRLVEVAALSGLRLCGPNCLGLINTSNGVMASFAFIVDAPDVDPATAGFVTQSGAYGALIYAQALYNGVGLKYFISVGNEADLEFADFLGHMVQDADIKVMGGYMEGAKDGDKLRRVAANAAKAGKPIMIMKVGRSSAGARAASSHTGSLAGEDKIYDAFFRQTGVVRIDAPDELVAFVPVISAGRLPKGKNMVLLTTSGGAGVSLADLSERLGLTVPQLSASARARMEKVLPFFASAQNPVDLTAQYITNPEILVECLNVLLEQDDVDIIIGNFDLKEPYGVEISRKVIEIYQRTEKTIVISPWVFPGTDEGEGVRALRRAGIPVIMNMYQAVRACAHLADYAEFLRRQARPEYQAPAINMPSAEVAEKIRHHAGPLSEGQSRQILAEFGVPVARGGLACSADEAAAMAEQIGYPVVLKVDSPDILHKTEAGAVRLNICSAQELRAAHAGILHHALNYKPDARINGVLVQEMLPPGIEVIVGVTRDPVFGPAVMFGLGGVFVEVLKDVAFRVAPISPGDALDMIKEIKGYRLLQGYRGSPPADVDALAEVLLNVSKLAAAYHDTIHELDINPLMVYPRGQGVKAADALIVFNQGAARD